MDLGFITNPKTFALIILFGIYLLSIIVFSIFYWRIYSHDPAAFAFNADVLRKQSASFRRVATKRLAYTKQTLLMLREAAKFIADNGLEEPKKISKWYEFRGRWIATLGRLRFTEQRSVVGGGPVSGPQAIMYELSIQDDTGIKFSRTFMEGPFDSRSIPELIELWINALEKEIKTTSHRVSSIQTKTPEVWSFLDFFYFSVISQTTVGYGDILPNSTRVRMLVSAQVVIASILLVVIINVILST